VSCLAQSLGFRWHIAGELFCLPKGAALPITLKAREYEVFTIVPLKVCIVQVVEHYTCNYVFLDKGLKEN